MHKGNWAFESRGEEDVCRLRVICGRLMPCLPVFFFWVSFVLRTSHERWHQPDTSMLLGGGGAAFARPVPTRLQFDTTTKLIPELGNASIPHTSGCRGVYMEGIKGCR